MRICPLIYGKMNNKASAKTFFNKSKDFQLYTRACSPFHSPSISDSVFLLRLKMMSRLGNVGATRPGFHLSSTDEASCERGH